MKLSSGGLARVFSWGALGLIASFSSSAFCATITLNTLAPTIGYGPPAGLGAGGPYFTYSAAPTTPFTVTGAPLVLDTSTATLGEYTYNPGELSADVLSFALSVTPTVNGTTATTPLVFNGTLTTGIHTITQPVPYFVDFDPASNASAQVITNGSFEFVALPFDGYLFGVSVTNPLSYPALDNATTAPLIGIVEPISQLPEPAAVWMFISGGLLLVVLRRRLKSSF